MPLELGQRGKQYAPVELVGRGAFGAAYLVRHRQTGLPYCMKKLDLSHMDKRAKEEALNECTVLERLRRHQNIITVHEHFEERGKLYIIMDYAGGGDLAGGLRRTPGGSSPLCRAPTHSHPSSTPIAGAEGAWRPLRRGGGPGLAGAGGDARSTRTR